MRAILVRGDNTIPIVAGTPAPDRLAVALVRFRLHGRITLAMVGRLDAYLDRLDAIPVEDWCRWQDGAGRWLALRCGPLTRPPPPHLWPWRTSLAAWTTQGYPLAVRARAAFLRLDAAGRRAAQGRWGRFGGAAGGQDFGGLWRLGTPVDAIRALDEKAVRTRVRVLTNDAGELAHQEQGQKRRRSARTRGGNHCG